MTISTVTRWNGEQTFTISRVFAASRSRVWRAWTERHELPRWFGPKGSTMPVCHLDLRPGGIFHYCLRVTADREMWGRWSFQGIIAPERLVLLQSFSDEQGGMARHPLDPTWPQEMLATITLTEHQGGTIVEVCWRVFQGTEEEHRTFDAAHASMLQGWTGTFDRLAEHLAHG